MHFYISEFMPLPFLKWKDSFLVHFNEIKWKNSHYTEFKRCYDGKELFFIEERIPQECLECSTPSNTSYVSNGTEFVL